MKHSVVVGTRRWRAPLCPELVGRVREEGLMVDTAEVYGRGRSEAAIGGALPDVPVMTKLMPWVWRSPRGFERHLAGSLRRLQRPAVAALLLHFPARRRQTAWVRALASAVHEGRARAVGLSNHGLADIRAALEILDGEGVPLGFVQAEVSLLQPRALWNGVRDLCAERGATLVGFRALGGGRLAGERGLPPVLAWAAARTAATPAQVAQAWVHHHDVLPIVGAQTAAFLDEALAARRLVLPADVVAELDAFARRRSRG